MVVIKPFEDSHFDLATPISKLTYWPDLWEPREAFSIRMKLFPGGCLSAFIDATLDGNYGISQYAGYVFSHPWKGNYIDLATVINELPADPDHYYIHDLLVNPNLRGYGIGTALFNAILPVAYHLRLPEMRLVSVLNSHPFWTKLGFEEIDSFYYAKNTPAKFMVKKL